jgi:hypothetical protein
MHDILFAFFLEGVCILHTVSTCFLVQDACWLAKWGPAAFPWVERDQSSPCQMLCFCTSLVMQAIHEDIYGVAWIETPEGWCNRALQHAAGGGQSRIVASPNVVNLHFFGDAISSQEESQYRTALINYLVVGGWCLCGILVVGERLDRSLHQTSSFGTSLDIHAFHEGISTAAWTKPPGGRWLVSCGAPVVGERSQSTDTLPNPAPALLWICTRCTKRYTMSHAPSTRW